MSDEPLQMLSVCRYDNNDCFASFPLLPVVVVIGRQYRLGSRSSLSSLKICMTKLLPNVPHDATVETMDDDHERQLPKPIALYIVCS